MPSLTSIPPELQLHISEYLGFEALGHLNQTSRYFNDLLDDEMLSRVSKESNPYKVKQALHYAVGFNAADRIRKILWHGKKAGLDLVNMRYRASFTVLDYDNYHSNGVTPLENALKTTFDMPDSPDYDREDLFIQCTTRVVELSTIKLLIEEGADVSAQGFIVDKRAEPPLYRSIALGKIEIIQHLLDSGGTSCINAPGRSVVQQAILKKSDVAIFRLLLEHGADVQGKSPGCKSPLHTALYYKDFEKASILLEWGAKINNKDGQGRTPLMCAAEDRKVEVVKWLLARRADVQAKGKKGTAETIAITCKSELEEAAADQKNEYEVIIQLLKDRRLSCEESKKKDEEFKEKQKASRGRR